MVDDFCATNGISFLGCGCGSFHHWHIWFGNALTFISVGMTFDTISCVDPSMCIILKPVWAPCLQLWTHVKMICGNKGHFQPKHRPYSLNLNTNNTIYSPKITHSPFICRCLMPSEVFHSHKLNFFHGRNAIRKIKETKKFSLKKTTYVFHCVHLLTFFIGRIRQWEMFKKNRDFNVIFFADRLQPELLNSSHNPLKFSRKSFTYRGAMLLASAKLSTVT